MSSPETLQTQFDRAQRIAFSGGAVGLALCVIFYFRDHTQFFHSYLMAYIFWISIPLGCMGVLMMHHLTGGWWGYPIRRLLEAGSRTFFLMVVLFVPLWLGMARLYEWARPGGIPTDAIHYFKRVYLAPGFFTLRAIAYFAIWLGLVYLLNRWSRDQDRTADPRFMKRLCALSGPGLVLWGLLVTAAAIDWVMSLEPEWFSTIYGMIFMVVEALVAMSFAIFVLRMLSDQEPIRDAVSAKQFNDLGNLMLTFLLLWAYLSFSQFLLIWAGNLKDEIPWYLKRAFGTWGEVAIVLIVLHFFVPFFLLLQRPLKRRLRTLSLLAAFMIVLSFVDIYWLVVPSYQAGPSVHLLDIFSVVGIGGSWVGAFFWQLKKMPLLPQHDPRFEGELLHEHGD
jgi:hypothetical protein